MAKVDYKPSDVSKMSDVEDLAYNAQINFADIGKELEKLGELDILGGRMLTDVELAVGATTVEHGLGRTYKGYIVVAGALNGDYPGEDTVSASKGSHITLTVAAAQTVDVWVF